MNSTVLAAFVAGVATVAAAAVTGIFQLRHHRKSDDQDSANKRSTGADASYTLHAPGQVSIVEGNQNVVHQSQGSTPPADSDLEVTRVDVTCDEHGNPVLDITLRNLGSTSALVHELIIENAEAFICPDFRIVEFARQGVTWEYSIDVDIEPAEVGRQHCYRLSQEVPAGGVDRFSVTLETNCVLPNDFDIVSMLYLFRGTIITDRDRKLHDLGHFLVRLQTGKRPVTGITRPPVVEPGATALANDEFMEIQRRNGFLDANGHVTDQALQSLQRTETFYQGRTPEAERLLGEAGRKFDLTRVIEYLFHLGFLHRGKFVALDEFLAKLPEGTIIGPGVERVIDNVRADFRRNY